MATVSSLEAIVIEGAPKLGLTCARKESPTCHWNVELGLCIELADTLATGKTAIMRPSIAIKNALERVCIFYPLDSFLPYS
jgi:hypothetical protein